METSIPLKDLPKLHVTPLATVICDSPQITVEVDDDSGKRVRLIFMPFQAMRMITPDCYLFPRGVSIASQNILEIKNSIWISELREAQKASDCEATFMNKARHFFLPLQDDFLEIVAWDVKVETVT